MLTLGVLGLGDFHVKSNRIRREYTSNYANESWKNRQATLPSLTCIRIHLRYLSYLTVGQLVRVLFVLQDTLRQQHRTGDRLVHIEVSVLAQSAANQHARHVVRLLAVALIKLCVSAVREGVFIPADLAGRVGRLRCQDRATDLCRSRGGHHVLPFQRPDRRPLRVHRSC